MEPERIKKVEAELLERFQAGDLGLIAQVTRIQLPSDAPARNWSLHNRLMVFMYSGQLDCRGFKQWLEVERWVRKGAQHDAIIFGHPVIYDDKFGRRHRDGTLLTHRFFPTIKVFSFKQTEGKPIEEYTPREPPALLEIASRLGVRVDYGPTVDCLGSCKIDGSQINAGTFDLATLAHEMGHAADALLNGKLKGGQRVDQEVRAELCACIICAIYGIDHTGNAWEYIKMYATNPMEAIAGAMAQAELIVDFIFAQDVPMKGETE